MVAATRPRKCLVAIPLHAPPCDAFRRGYSNLLAQMVRSNGLLGDWKLSWQERTGGGLVLVRNILAAKAIKENHDVLFFLAGDIGCAEDNLARDLSRILSHFDREDVNLVGGCYLFKRIPLRLVVNQDEWRKPDEFGLIEVANTGLDFMAIRVSALVNIIEQWPLISARMYGAVIPLAYESFIDNEGRSQGLQWNLFGMAPVFAGDHVEFLPEDYYFQRLAKEAGCKIQVDTHVRLQHYGLHNFDAATATGIEEAIATVNPPLPYP